MGETTASSRSKLFEGVFGAYRNERVHKEKDIYSFEEEAEFLRELFLLNELFILESKLLLNTEKQVY